MREKQYDTAVGLSWIINLDGTLQKEGELRVDRTVELYRSGAVQTLTMSGRHDKIDWDAPVTHAEAMARYAVEQGVPRNDIYIEDRSLDTVGQAYFVKRYVVIPNNWGDLVVVSSDWHMERVREIFDFIFGTEFNVGYESSESTRGVRWTRAPKEWPGRLVFRKSFRGINSGDDKAITERLFSSHPLYKVDKN